MAEQLGKFVAPVSAAEPGSPVAGQVYFDSDEGTLYYYSGSAWVSTKQSFNRRAWRPTGTKAETYPRALGALQNMALLTSGTLYVGGGIELLKGMKLKEIHYYAATTAGVELKNQWAVLLDANRKVLARTGDKTTGAWGANEKKTFTIEAPSAEYEILEDGPYYLGLLVVATTVPTIQGRESINSFPLNAAPILGGVSNTGLTIPSGLAIGATATALTGTVRIPYATVN